MTSERPSSNANLNSRVFSVFSPPTMTANFRSPMSRTWLYTPASGVWSVGRATQLSVFINHNKSLMKGERQRRKKKQLKFCAVPATTVIGRVENEARRWGDEARCMTKPKKRVHCSTMSLSLFFWLRRTFSRLRKTLKIFMIRLHCAANDNWKSYVDLATL